jgi:ketosteroid isomerase-like protein
MSRKRCLTIITFLVTLVSLSSNHSILADGSSDETAKAIASAGRQFITALEKGDAKGMAALYTERAWLMPPNHDFVKGRAKIQSFWQGVIDSGIKSGSLKTLEIEEFGDTVVELGEYTLRGCKEEVDKGKYVLTWKKEAGQWKMRRDCWNSSKSRAAK